MIKKLKDIQRAIECECYLSALALTLTLPDICSKVESGEKGRNSYIFWYDKYVKPLHYIKGENAPEHQFNGELCYALRCSFLHSGNYEFEQKKEKINIEFELHADKVLGEPNIHDSYRKMKDGRTIIDLDVYGLCHCICKAVKNFYYEYENKEEFKKYESVIQNESWSDETYKKIFR